MIVHPPGQYMSPLNSYKILAFTCHRCSWHPTNQPLAFTISWPPHLYQQRLSSLQWPSCFPQITRNSSSKLLKPLGWSVCMFPKKLESTLACNAARWTDVLLTKNNHSMHTNSCLQSCSYARKFGKFIFKRGAKPSVKSCVCAHVLSFFDKLRANINKNNHRPSISSTPPAAPCPVPPRPPNYVIVFSHMAQSQHTYTTHTHTQHMHVPSSRPPTPPKNPLLPLPGLEVTSVEWETTTYLQLLSQICTAILPLLTTTCEVHLVQL